MHRWAAICVVLLLSPQLVRSFFVTFFFLDRFLKVTAKVYNYCNTKSSFIMPHNVIISLRPHHLSFMMMMKILLHNCIHMNIPKGIFNNLSKIIFLPNLPRCIMISCNMWICHINLPFIFTTISRFSAFFPFRYHESLNFVLSIFIYSCDFFNRRYHH